MKEKQQQQQQHHDEFGCVSRLRSSRTTGERDYVRGQRSSHFCHSHAPHDYDVSCDSLRVCMQAVCCFFSSLFSVPGRLLVLIFSFLCRFSGSLKLCRWYATNANLTRKFIVFDFRLTAACPKGIGKREKKTNDWKPPADFTDFTHKTSVSTWTKTLCCV